MASIPTYIHKYIFHLNVIFLKPNISLLIFFFFNLIFRAVICVSQAACKMLGKLERTSSQLSFFRPKCSSADLNKWEYDQFSKSSDF